MSAALSPNKSLLSYNKRGERTSPLSKAQSPAPSLRANMSYSKMSAENSFVRESSRKYNKAPLTMLARIQAATAQASTEKRDDTQTIVLKSDIEVLHTTISRMKQELKGVSYILQATIIE